MGTKSDRLTSLPARLAAVSGVLALGVACGLAPALAAKADPLTTVERGDMIMGSPNAPVTVIEYASLSSPHSADFNNDVFQAFKARYIDTGKVRFVLREFLTPPENFAAAGVLVARCGGGDHYFQVVDAIFRDQAAMITSGEIRGGFLKIAESAGITETEFNSCVNDDKALAALNRRVETYISRDLINGAPTVVVNGKVLGGALNLAALDAAVAEAQGSKP